MQTNSGEFIAILVKRMVVIFVMIVAPTVSKESPSNVEITFSNLKILDSLIFTITPASLV